MAGEWYCQIRGRQTGPLSNEQLKQLADEQTIGPDNLVRSGRDGSWMPARRVEGLFAAGASAASASRSAVALKTASPLSAGGSAPRRAAPTNGGSASARVPPPAPSGAVPPAPAWAPSPAAPVAPKPTPVPMTGGGTSPDAAFAGEAHPDSLPAPRSGSVGKIIAIVLISVFGVMALLCGAIVGVGYAVKFRFEAIRHQREESLEETRSNLDALAKAVRQYEQENASNLPSVEQGAAIQVKDWHNARARIRTSFGVILDIASVQYLSSRAQLTDPETSGGVGGGPVVLVEVTVANLSSKPVEFQSWSRGGQASEELQAVMIDDRGNLCPPVNNLGSKVDALLAEDEVLESRESVTDLLIFEAPAGSPEYVRLALPYAAVGREGYIGFEIPREMLMPSAGTLGNEGVPGADNVPAPAQPETIDDLKKAIEASRDRK